MKEFIQEYGSLLLSVIGAVAAFALITVAFLSEDGAFAGLLGRFTAYVF